jgi:hypothetical protein
VSQKGYLLKMNLLLEKRLMKHGMNLYQMSKNNMHLLLINTMTGCMKFIKNMWQKHCHKMKKMNFQISSKDLKAWNLATF